MARYEGVVESQSMLWESHISQPLVWPAVYAGYKQRHILKECFNNWGSPVGDVEGGEEVVEAVAFHVLGVEDDDTEDVANQAKAAKDLNKTSDDILNEK